MRLTDNGKICAVNAKEQVRLQKCGKLKNDNSTYIAGFQDAYEYGKGQGVMIEIEEV